jgi:cytidyltransferase-like protein
MMRMSRMVAAKLDREFPGQWFAFWGTLLGIERHAGHVIPWDGDVDFVLLGKTHAEIRELVDRWREEHPEIKHSPTPWHCRSIHHGGVGADIFEGRIEDGKLISHDLKAPIPWIGLRRDTLEGIPVNVPINAHQCLTAMYGDHWIDTEWDRRFAKGRPRPVLYADGVFDLLHHGHLRLLRFVASLGKLVVGVHSDAGTEAYKRLPVHHESHRYDLVRSLRYVDRVIEDAPLNPTCAWLDEHGIDFVVHGNNMDQETAEIWYGHAMKGDRFLLVPSTPGISTTELIAEAGTR